MWLNRLAMATDKALLQLADVGVTRDVRMILRDVNLTVNYGDFMAITGPNGGGKTTLLRVMLGLLKPTAGRVERFDRYGNSTNRLEIGYLPQKSAIDSHFPLTVADVIASGLLGSAEPHERVREVIELMELRSHANHPIGALSGGQLQRALLGRALVARPDVLVLDEPLSYLDKHFEGRVYEILGDESRRGVTVMLVSHEMTTISAMANRHVIVDRTVRECTSQHHMVHYDCLTH